LLEKLLQPEAGERPKTMEDVLDHPFFVGESTEELEKEKEKLQIQLKEAQERGETAETLRTLKEEIAKNSGVLLEVKRGQAEIQSTTQRVATTTERMEKEQKRQTQLLEAIDERTIKIEGISDQTFLQLCKTERVLLRSMFEATEVTLPTSFVILPSEIEAEGPSPACPLIQLAEDGSGVELGAVGEEVKKKIEKRKGWFDKVCKLGTSIATG
jgi:hypothetical protein